MSDLFARTPEDPFVDVDRVPSSGATEGHLGGDRPASDNGIGYSTRRAQWPELVAAPRLAQAPLPAYSGVPILDEL